MLVATILGLVFGSCPPRALGGLLPHPVVTTALAAHVSHASRHRVLDQEVVRRVVRERAVEGAVNRAAAHLRSTYRRRLQAPDVNVHVFLASRAGASP